MSLLILHSINEVIKLVLTDAVVTETSIIFIFISFSQLNHLASVSGLGPASG